MLAEKRAMLASAMTILWVLAAYLAIGFMTALAFVSIGAQQVTHSSFTLGARLLLLPGATALWPYVLVRWAKARRNA
jgi:hypothetical protein